jgi:hypothetical protein
MLLNVNDLLGFRLCAGDEPVAVLRDLLFDENSSSVRYLVTDPEAWLATDQVLIAPAALTAVHSEAGRLETSLSKETFAASPALAAGTDLSRPHEERLHQHHGWTPYWRAAGAAGLAPYWGAAGSVPAHEPAAFAAPEPDAAAAGAAETRLRSARDVIGFYIEALDGDIGHVEDLVLDLERWVIRYLVVDTRNWLPGRRVVVSPAWLRRLDWASRSVVLDLDRERIRNSPAYDRNRLLDRAFEEDLHRHVDRPGYWQ